MNNPLISILVPCYNVVPWLSRCLESILAQTYTNWEAILVNDGSKDNTGEVLEEYAKLDSRFKVVHQENRGHSGARNTGLNHMSGEWMTWIDADDEVMPDYLEDLIKSATVQHPDAIPCDLVIAKNTCIFESGERTIIGKLDDAVYDVKDYVPQVIPKAIFGGTRILLQTQLIKENNLLFDESVVYAEDYLFLQEAILRARRIHTIAKTGYLYYFRSGDNAAHNSKGTIAQETALFQHAQLLSREMQQKYPHSAKLLASELTNTLNRVFNALYYTPGIGYKQWKETLEALNITPQDIHSSQLLKRIQHKMLFQKHYRLLQLCYQVEQIKNQVKLRLAQWLKR